MPDYHRIVREVSWHDLFPWLLLLRTCRLAAEFRRLLLASLGIVLTGCGWWVIDTSLLDEQQRGAAAALSAAEPGVPEVVDLPGSSLLHVPFRETSRAFVANWRSLTRPARMLFARGLSWNEFAAALLAVVWAIAVWAFCGGAICRLSAVQLGREEQLSVFSAARFALRKWLAYASAVGMPLAMAVLFSLPLLLAGLVSRIDVGLLLAGIVWPLALVCGVLLMLLVVGLAAGFPLMWAAISSDGSDSFDAISRSYSYVSQRPLNYLFYLLVSLVVGSVGWLIINTLAALTIYLASWGASLGSGEERWRQVEQTPPWFAAAETGLEPAPPPFAESAAPLAGIGGTGARLIGCWNGCVRLLALAYGYSFFWTAGAGMYLLLRRDTDAMELDEVLLEGEDDPASLPAVRQDDAGVNVLADEPEPA